MNPCVKFSSLAFVATAIFVSGDEQKSSNPSWGKGTHTEFFIYEWDGKEQVVTSLQKGSETIEYVRIAVDEFIIRKKIPNSDIFFRFSHKEDGLSPGLAGSFLVDFVEEKERVAALLLGSRGYYYIQSSINTPKFEPPDYYFIPRRVMCDKWKPVYWLGPGDYYNNPTIDRRSDNTITNVRLKTINEVEFTMAVEKEEKDQIDVFTIQQDQLLKNGVKLEDTDGYNIVKYLRKFRFFDKNWIEIVLNSEATLDDVYEKVDRYRKEDIMFLISKIEDKATREKVLERVNAAYKSKNPANER